MIRTLALALCAVAAASSVAAQASCPTAADLDRGIRVEFNDGATEVFRRSGPGIVGMEALRDGRVEFRLEMAHGTHILKYEAVVGGQVDQASVQTYNYGMSAEETPVPQSGSRWQPAVVVSAADGDRDEPQAQVYDQIRSEEIGGCTYDIVPVLIAYDTGDNYFEAINYIPALGFGYLVRSQNDVDASDPRTPIRIAAGK